MWTSAVLPAAEANFWAERRKAAHDAGGGSTTVPAGGASPPRWTNAAFSPDDGATREAEAADTPRTLRTSGHRPVPVGLAALATPHNDIEDFHLIGPPEAAGPWPFDRPPEPLVVLVQDVHGVVEAQTNISRMLESFQARLGLELLGLEGAAGGFILNKFRAVGEPEALRWASDVLLRERVLSGAEHFALNAPGVVELWGVESADAYLANVEAYKKTESFRPAVERFERAAVRALEGLQQKVYGPDLLAFERRRALYDREAISLAEHIESLAGDFAVRGGIDLKPYPNIAHFRRVFHFETTIDFKRVETERAAFVEALIARLPPDDLERLRALGVDHRLRRVGFDEYQRVLAASARRVGVGLDPFPEVQKYLEYARLSGRVAPRPLLAELARLEGAVESSFASTPARREAVRLARDWAILGKLFHHAMDSADWKAYQGRRSEVRSFARRLAAALAENGIPHAAPDMDFSIDAHEAFYESAHARNEHFVDSLLERMRSTDRRRAVLVAGGFHTEGLREILARRGVNHVVVTPRFTSTEGGEDYLDVFTRGPTPLERMLLGEKLLLRGQLGGAATPTDLSSPAPRTVRNGLSALGVLAILSQGAASPAEAAGRIGRARAAADAMPVATRVVDAVLTTGALAVDLELDGTARLRAILAPADDPPASSGGVNIGAGALALSLTPRGAARGFRWRPHGRSLLLAAATGGLSLLSTAALGADLSIGVSYVGEYLIPLPWMAAAAIVGSALGGKSSSPKGSLSGESTGPERLESLEYQIVPDSLEGAFSVSWIQPRSGRRIFLERIWEGGDFTRYPDKFVFRLRVDGSEIQTLDPEGGALHFTVSGNTLLLHKMDLGADLPLGGIGTEILEWMVRFARQRGVQTIHSTVTHNPVALQRMANVVGPESIEFYEPDPDGGGEWVRADEHRLAVIFGPIRVAGTDEADKVVFDKNRRSYRNQAGEVVTLSFFPKPGVTASAFKGLPAGTPISRLAFRSRGRIELDGRTVGRVTDYSRPVGYRVNLAKLPPRGGGRPGGRSAAESLLPIRRATADPPARGPVTDFGDNRDSLLRLHAALGGNSPTPAAGPHDSKADGTIDLEARFLVNDALRAVIADFNALARNPATREAARAAFGRYALLSLWALVQRERSAGSDGGANTLLEMGKYLLRQRAELFGAPSTQREADAMAELIRSVSDPATALPRTVTPADASYWPGADNPAGDQNAVIEIGDAEEDVRQKIEHALRRDQEVFFVSAGDPDRAVRVFRGAVERLTIAEEDLEGKPSARHALRALRGAALSRLIPRTMPGVVREGKLDPAGIYAAIARLKVSSVGERKDHHVSLVPADRILAHWHTDVPDSLKEFVQFLIWAGGEIVRMSPALAKEIEAIRLLSTNA